jgi:SnoaL-like domain
MEPELRELLDRQQILDCVHRYARGVDRLDAELVLSAYHEDAIDSHGPFSGTPPEFIEWLWPRQATRRASQHMIANHLVELDGDVAHGETYWLTALCSAEPDQVMLAGGRWVDRFERRDGSWRIAVRNVVSEWSTTLAGEQLLGEPYAQGARDRSDISYQRPLRALGALVASPPSA